MTQFEIYFNRSLYYLVVLVLSLGPATQLFQTIDNLILSENIA
jgi:hypothetical protein